MLTTEIISNMQIDIKKSIKNINYGGCIQFAYYFSKALKKLGIQYRIVFLDYFTIPELTYDNFTPVHHVMVYIPEIGYIDGEETSIKAKEFSSQFYRSALMSSKKLDYFRTNFRWSRKYDLTQNSKLEKIISKHINERNHLRKAKTSCIN